MFMDLVTLQTDKKVMLIARHNRMFSCIVKLLFYFQVEGNVMFWKFYLYYEPNGILFGSKPKVKCQYDHIIEFFMRKEKTKNYSNNVPKKNMDVFYFG